MSCISTNVPFTTYDCFCAPGSHSVFGMIVKSSLLLQYWDQCWGKLLFQVMHYNIVLLPMNVNNFIIFLTESNVICYF